MATAEIWTRCQRLKQNKKPSDDAYRMAALGGATAWFLFCASEVPVQNEPPLIFHTEEYGNELF